MAKQPAERLAASCTSTPPHLAELIASMANISRGSRVLDICAGHGALLAAAQAAGASTTSLVAVEQQPDVFAALRANLVGCRAGNLHQGSCFDPAIIKLVKKHKCDIGLLNPPFNDDVHELAFLKQMLECLEVGGTGIAILPIGRVISDHELKADLLREHTLEASMSLPLQIFDPVQAVCVAVVFKAKVPHSGKTWFGYWRNDGFERIRHSGRVDRFGRWPAIRDKWVKMFKGRAVVRGESLRKLVDANDEWCAEAYLEADYATITKPLFERELKRRIISILSQEAGDADDDAG